jgi:hypothetical protein
MFLFACSHPPDVVEVPVERPLPTRYAAELVRASFGVNEPVSLPKKIALDLDLGARHQRIDQALEKLKWLGISRVRLHSATYPYLSFHGQIVEQAGDTSAADDFYARILGSGLDPLVMIGPWPGNEPMAFTDRYLPDDFAAYTAWVTRTVERYDGDGVDDAPGIGVGIHAWEVDNEPDLHNTAPPRSKPDLDPSQFSTAEQYVRLFRATKAAILVADSGAMVIPGGLWRPFESASQEYARAEGDLGAVNLHAYPRQGLADLWAGVDAVGRPDRPLWITETSTSASRSERDQAVDLASLFLEGLRRDVRTTYWHALTEAPDLDDTPPRPGVARGRHLFTGYPRDVGPKRAWIATHPRVAAWTLRELLRRYGDLPRGGIQEIPVQGAHGLHLGSDVVLWDEDGHTSKVTLDWPVRAAVRVARLVPLDEDGGAVETPRFHIAEVTAGVVHIDLADGPVAISPR